MVERVGIVAKRCVESAGPWIVEIAAWLEKRGIEPVLDDRAAAMAGPGRRTADRETLPHLVDLLLVLGGDGTLLRMADRVSQAGCDIPILGVNFGHLGFLTDIAIPDLYPALEAALAGTAAIEQRMVLRATVVRAGSPVSTHVALNDVVVTRGALSRIIELSVWVGNEFVARFHADGLIVASPTGSTAYNLSAGGPILHPAVDALVLTPIAPHTLSNRPVVIPASAAISLAPHVVDRGQEVLLTLDGQSGVRLEPCDTVQVAGNGTPVRLIHATARGYFDVLREKLKWAER